MSKSQIPNPTSQRRKPKAQSRTRLYFFGGKGGVGKTTCAAATAVALGARGRRVLAVSTDPAHSLGDAFGVSLSDRPRRVRRGVFGVEVDAARAFGRWLARHRRALADALEQGTWLDRTDVEALLDVPLPGIDELAALIEIGGFADGSVYDAIVVDTAPTGHTLRLLVTPRTVEAFADLLDELQEDHREIRRRFASAGEPDAADRVIALIGQQARDLGRLLTDRSRTRFDWVLLPETLSLAETEDAAAALVRERIPFDRIVVNRLTPDGRRCPVCDRRRRAERAVVLAIPTRLHVSSERVVEVMAQPAEPHGVTRLAAVGRQLLAISRGRSARHRPGGRRAPGHAVFSTRSPAPAFDLPAPIPWRGVRLLFFGGKGGVGKTTVAAAAALRLAETTPTSRILLLSTDPAHSLGDVFERPVGDRPAAVSGGPRNLYLQELDATAAFARRRRQVEDTFRTLTSERLFDLAPPGVDELFGILSVIESRERYERLVIDTAPTGHVLRLLETPDLALRWVQLLMRMLLKYRSIAPPGRLGAELLQLSQSLKALQALLRDGRQTQFVTVTRAARLPRVETERLVTSLRRLRLSAPTCVVNALTLGPAGCPLCRRTAAAERRELAAMRRRNSPLSGCVIIQTPLSAPPPRGVPALDRWIRTWQIA